MKLSGWVMAATCGLLWGGSLLVVGLLGVVVPGYGKEFLAMVSSVYPWFHASGSVIDTLVGTVEGALDGAAGGAVFAWLYNVVASRHAIAAS